MREVVVVANEKNLIPNSRRTPEERRENARKAGKKSAEVRRRKKLLRECMVDLLALPVANAKEWNKLVKMGLDVEDIDNRALLTAALFRKAVEQGDVAAFKEIRNLVGEDVGQEVGELDKLIEGLKNE